MYQALEKACCTVASLCSGLETGLAPWVRIKNNNRESSFLFIRALSVSTVGLSSRLSSKCRLIGINTNISGGSFDHLLSYHKWTESHTLNA